MPDAYGLFSVIGIEIEYMIVDTRSLDVCSFSERILSHFASDHAIEDSPPNEVSLGDIQISNELVLHVLEFKNHGPRSLKEPLAKQFHEAIRHVQSFLTTQDLCLLPTGAHPWMNPSRETRRWPHGQQAIYEQFDKIFNCKGHGFSNLQSMHVNLPFSHDEEFNILHNTTRLLLPLLPSLAASTPILEQKKTSFIDTRLSFYEQNQKKIPCITGDVIPEFIETVADYNARILKPMYQAIAPLDPAGHLQYEWLNSRAAIPKFEYGALEIRILDTQECPNADIAIAKAIHFILEHQSSTHQALPIETKRLKSIYDQTIQHGFSCHIDDTPFLEAWSLPKRTLSLKHVWSYLIERISTKLSHEEQSILEQRLCHGNLSEQILKACGDNFSKTHLHGIYKQLAECLHHNHIFGST